MNFCDSLALLLVYGSKVTEIVHLRFIFGSGKRRANYPVKKLILDFAFYASDVDRDLLLTRCRDSAPLQKPKNPKISHQYPRQTKQTLNKPKHTRRSGRRLSGPGDVDELP